MNVFHTNLPFSCPLVAGSIDGSIVGKLHPWPIYRDAIDAETVERNLVRRSAIPAEVGTTVVILGDCQVAAVGQPDVFRSMPTR